MMADSKVSLAKAVRKAKTSGWLLFGYDVPEKPSRIRVRVWRQLKGLGALYPQMSFCILRDSPQTRSRLEDLASSLKAYSPKLIVQAKATNRLYLHTLLTLFKEDIEKEYRELAEECEEFLDEIKDSVSSGNVTQTEVSELEEALEGLGRWHARTRARDFIGSTAGMKIQRLLRRCRNALLSFSEKAQPAKKNEVPSRRMKK